MMRDLTEREIRFCDEYLICFNAKEAALKAGYSKRSAKSIGSENLTKPDIQRYLTIRKKRVIEKIELSQERVMQEIGRIALANPKALFNEDGTIKKITEMDDDIAAAISSFEVEELFAGSGKNIMQVGITTKPRLWSKTDALGMLAKHFKIFSDAPVNNNQVSFGYGAEKPV